MNNIILYIIIFLGIVIIPLYYSVKKFTSFKGVLLFLLSFIALFLRNKFVDQEIRFINSDTLISSLLLISIPAVIFILYTLTRKEPFKKGLGYFIRLLPLYILFGAFQQIMFLYVFSDVIDIIYPNNTTSVILSVLFFTLYHLDWLFSDIKNLFPVLIIFSIINTFTYLVLGNLLIPLIFHGILATILFSSYSNRDQIRGRLGN